ncbi:RNA-binding protein Prp24 [Fomitopsis betulina]|nr:RNA-binding protein Prp24 [Fomitopsis betulina]
MDESAALEALANILNRLADDPYDITLHIEHVRIAQQTGMDDQVDSALEMAITFWTVGDYVWGLLLERKLQGSDLESPEALQAILDLFNRAEQDYLSIPLLRKHLDFLAERYEHFASLEARPEEFGDMFTASWMRVEMPRVVEKGAGHLTQSHLLWDVYKDWEMEQLQNASPAERAELQDHVELVLLKRLQQPHSNHEETFQGYSSFTTNFKPPEEYEPLLVEASKMRAQPVKAYEKRESLEASLAQSGYSLEGYAYYIASERRKKPDLFVVQGLYERAIAEADKRRWNGETTAEAALRSFWAGYLDVLRIQEVEADVQATAFQRALKSVPASGEVWARYLRFLERIAEPEGDSGIADAYEKTKTIRPLQADVEQLVPVVLARAGHEKRLVEATQTGEGFDTLVAVVLDGVSRIRIAAPAGDPRLRVEKFFSGVCSTFSDLSQHALVLWEDATKHYKNSYLAWTAYTDVLIKQGLYEDARRVFKDLCMKHLDWPEAIWDAWLAFEQLHGTIEELEHAMDKVEFAQGQTNLRRQKEVEKAEQVAMQLIAEQRANMAPISEAPASAVAGGYVPMDVDSGPSPSGGTKRKAEEEASAGDASKKAKTDQKPLLLKRDRENCTVFVADLPEGTKEDELKALFKDCGAIREIKMTRLPNSLVATVEFMERDSVPAALTKDKKRVDGQEVAVHLAWQSTLYITNFPEKADDTFIRALLAKYGTIFDVRWPSKKFKATRRFCYVQFTSPASAQAALELHGTQIGTDMSLNVYISNPERRKERSDADANDREVYVAGLSRFTTKEDLETLFKTYGAVKEVRMALDSNGRPKGFAFVEFEDEHDAVAALGANNHELKNRRMAVTLADSRVRARTRDPNARADIRNRTIYIRNLPADTQEALLQQALEKFAPVKRVEVFADRGEADVQFENAADVGKLLLRTAPIVFNGNTLDLVADAQGAPRVARNASSAATSGSGMFVPRAAASRPRAGLGSKKRNATISAVTSSSSAVITGTKGPASGQSRGQDDFRKMLG